MKALAIITILAALGFAYLYWVRPYLKSLPQFAEAWQNEATTGAAIKAWLDGRKTILAGMWGEIAAWLPDLLQIISGVDLKTALSLPDNWALIIGGLAVPVLMMVFRSKSKPAA
jgi:hypothetical protein